MPDRHHSHPAQVDAWFRSNAQGLGRQELLALFERAFQAVFDCARSTLSEVTMTAILERVLYSSLARFPFLSAVQFNEHGISFTRFRKSGKSPTRDELTAAFRFMLIELLAILGSLTGQVITPALHAQLFKITSQKRAKK